MSEEELKSKYDVLVRSNAMNYKEAQDYKQENQQLKSVLNEVREILSQGITFCKNDSQGAYDVCNITINREKKILEILDKVGDK